MSLQFPPIHIEQHPLRPERLFLDTEFTQFGAPGKSSAKLISIALVDEKGRRFYAELSGWTLDDCTDFVRAEVMPHLEHTSESAASAANRLNQFLKGYDFAVVHCDYRGDWDWLLWLIDQSTDGTVWPSALHHESFVVDTRDWPTRAQEVAKDAQARWTAAYPKHHAFHDANGLRYVWQSACLALGGVEDPSSSWAVEHCCV